MKNNPNINTIQAFWPKPSAMAAAILLLTASAFQGFSQAAPPTLTLTEVNSTTLTWSFPGFSTVSVADTTPDHWSFSLPFAITLGEPMEASWAEPDTSGTFNTVVLPTTVSAQLAVTSDGLPGGVGPVVGNGVPVVGADASGTINVTFVDDGDAPGNGTVPDGASTALLALPAILALCAMARLRKSSIPA